MKLFKRNRIRFMVVGMIDGLETEMEKRNLITKGGKDE